MRQCPTLDPTTQAWEGQRGTPQGSGISSRQGKDHLIISQGGANKTTEAGTETDPQNQTDRKTAKHKEGRAGKKQPGA